MEEERCSPGEVSSSSSGGGNENAYRPPTLLSGRRPNVCMVSDFFYPGLGGVEMHIYQLAVCLIARGYKVVVVTHSRGERVGVRYMPGGLKVYYYPWPVMYEQCVWPSFCFSAPVFREIWVRENIHIVHGHQVHTRRELRYLPRHINTPRQRSL
eukprot:Gregarina_sp_Poly_1__9528@NODE_59_length_17172_cov_76_315580_g50_i0_p4_GENE_NODE_59_length_17172_cov_76_315580_g50_i0NODE_59_length_17172_cov_76_315580_g50_i0_p4_ORF_typecomplete_len154_score0_69PIGA/PF08288_12/5_1e21Glyco_transf_4/PF13439_6/3e08Glyco_trans_4_4/PF13579_6/5_7e05Glyco_trans_4_2/PF13477_6/0_01PAFAH_p_II/PF03403_13/0_15AraC_N/PF06719_13/0_26_NODE_59_length_17172_cov_76_315580_g50_i01615016611